MNLSYWETKTWFSNIDFCIVGSGITGLNCALNLKTRFPKSKILVLERGMLLNGASTKNAGFACFGSVSEILEDLNSHSEEEVLQLIQKRLKGLNLLRKNLGDKNIGYKEYGGYELFTKEDQALFEECTAKLPELNKMLEPLFGEAMFSIQKNSFGFRDIQKKIIFNQFEGQLNTGGMMETLLYKVQKAGIKILNNVNVEEFTEAKNSVKIKTDKLEFLARKLLIATNGFSEKLGIAQVKPARAQVLITKPIKNLEIKGTFHLDKGYYYFRNIDDCILFGGGRNLDFKTEETTEMAQTKLIQQKLEELLKNTILPETSFEIEHRWSGIMGIGKQKNPIVKQVSENVYCGVRLGGMGVAIGSLVGKELSELII
ncbi:NAD(P)/FAD-dependent oxidoreductase [Salegentibacter maritimus]|uniref:NAD(P)/FAD-dependent oxidoreductase n=1 Tax=Salegentibacter maritimus TaxID=2794347 RepID=UPI0018E435CD|nr:FAD-dependent oxidoreductase [Salegentibacter maritimus]MBI6116172.1 FAD-binding oxidoreductase [Salegentibacter maritimus]